ncbi:sensor histidine kinase [Dictyobacter aurantiacus]|uniref:histidine kinase n=1 Tax=Dictyobacter aurantiacus TaxID=1936993 RepID=A0A401ZFY3_9CHLR|nr:ATP-binding protein [Dictyobacter aurantiacus]GCE05746.1 hypothetical protein KDAU_30750 [Dictyobacter aurantiacus]
MRHIPGKNTRQVTVPCAWLQGLFQPFTEGVIICDQAGKILQMNPAALTLFEVSAEAVYRGTDFQRFLHTFQRGDDPQAAGHQELWLSQLGIEPPVEPYAPEQTLLLHLPSGRQATVAFWHAPLLDDTEQVAGTMAVFRQVTSPYQQGLHLQQVHETIAALNMAIASLPAYGTRMLPERSLLLSPLVSSIARPLMDMIHQVLDGRRVMLTATGSSGQLWYIAGSGFTPEQEQVVRAAKGVVASMFVDDQVIARLSARQEVQISSQDLRKLPSFLPVFDSEDLLLLPLFLEERFAGQLIVFKASSANGYTPEEIQLAKIVVVEIELLVECLGILHERIASGTRSLVQQEVGRLSNDFLTLASHELRTPLTGIIGNIQLAQHRLNRLKRQIREQTGEVNMSIEQIEDPLASAIECADLQQDALNGMIDTLSIPAEPTEARMQEENLLTLLHDTLDRVRRSAPERAIALKVPPGIQAVFIRADGQQIVQVLTNYLVNALSHSGAAQPVAIQLIVTDTVALILVHDAGLGIVTEEQKALWQHFSHKKELATQHGADMNLGTGFYLCRMLIEQHHGQVGVQSHPEQGTTFWLTLPIVALLAK